MVSGRTLALALAIGCASPPEEDPRGLPPPPDEWHLAYTLDLGAEGGVLRSVCPDVLVQCADAPATDACPADLPVRVFAREGAEDAPGRPFGIASCIVLEWLP